MIITISIVIIVAIAITGFVFALNNTISKNSNFNKHEICFKEPFEITNLPLIQLKVFGKYEWFLVDSGASINLIKQSYFDRLNKKPKLIDNKNPIFTGSNEIKSEYCTLNLRYEKTKFNEEIFNVAQLNVFDFNKELYKRDIIGIIGSPFFEKYGWNIDFEDMKIYFKK